MGITRLILAYGKPADFYLQETALSNFIVNWQYLACFMITCFFKSNITHYKISSVRPIINAMKYKMQKVCECNNNKLVAFINFYAHKDQV